MTTDTPTPSTDESETAPPPEEVAAPVAAHPGAEPTPPYLKGRFVAAVVSVAVVAGLLLTNWGTSGNRAENTVGAGRDSVPVAVERDATKGSIQDCPQAGAAVDLEAARTIRLFLAAAAGQNLAGLQVSDEVKTQLTANARMPAVLRMTRSRGFSTESGTVSSCAQSYWVGSDGSHTSTDLVVVAPAAKGWQVKQWIRGESTVAGRADSAPLSFYGGSGSCGTPDRVASVQLPAGSPSDRLHVAVEELASGSAGRAMGASSAIPADVQVVSASVDGLSARVELTPTTEKLSDCTGRAAVTQIATTATAIALAALPPEQTTTTVASKSRSRQAAAPAVRVEVVVNGAPVTSLRP